MPNDYSPGATFPSFPLALPLDTEELTYETLCRPLEKLVDAVGVIWTGVGGIGGVGGVGTRQQSGTPMFYQGYWVPPVDLTVGIAYVSINAGIGAPIFFPLSLPDGSTLTSVGVPLAGPSHAAFPGGAPGTMPAIQLFKMSATGVRTIIASATDTTATNAAYAAVHSITVTVSEAVDNGAYTYWVALTPEKGAGASIGTFVYHPHTVTA